MTAKIRQYFYLFSALASSVVPILVTLRVLTETQGNSWLGLVALIGGVLGTAGAGTAGVILGKQRKDGTLDPAPEPLSPLEAVLSGLPAVVQDKLDADDRLEQVKKVALDSLSQIPVVGTAVEKAIRDQLGGK